jgi:hypothetical protein
MDAAREGGVELALPSAREPLPVSPHAGPGPHMQPLEPRHRVEMGSPTGR